MPRPRKRTAAKSPYAVAMSRGDLAIYLAMLEVEKYNAAARKRDEKLIKLPWLEDSPLSTNHGR